MKQSTSFTQVAKTTQLLSSMAHLRLMLVMFLTLTVTTNAWGADVTVKWTASSGELGSGIGSGTIKTGSFSWDYTRTLQSGDSYTGWTENCIQLGKKGGVENITFKTSAIPGTIKIVSIECASYQGKHNVAITVGDNSYLASTATSSWTTVEAKTGKGAKSGEIVISFTGGSRALYIKSISVTYEKTPTWKLKGTWDGWTEHAMTVNGTEATCQINLAQGQGYEFGFDGNGSFYKNSGAIITDISGWVFSTDANDARLYTGPAGTYTFKINTSTKQVQVIYPTVTHPAEGYAYFQKQDSWNGFKVYNFTSDNDRLSDWAGSPTVTNTTTICGKTYYYTALATQFQKVIFHDNGNNQWNEINVSGYSGKYCGDDYYANPQTWKEFNKYSITFNSNGGSGTMSTISGICPGDNQTLPANTFTCTGYTFDGWATSANGNKVYNDKATISNINSNITLYARWEADTYTITSNLTNCSSSPAIPTSYIYTGSAANLSYTISAASGYRLPDAVTVSGTTYTWDKNTGLLTLTGTINSNVTITITAIKVHTITWMVNKQTYTTGNPTTSVDDGSTYQDLTLPTTPANNTLDECYPGKKFVGWSTTNIGSTESDKPSILFKTAAEAPNTTITENTTLYAVFATETGGGTTTTSKSTTLDFSAQGYADQTTISSLTIGDITAAFNKGSNNNDPKYYTSGTAVRVYGGGYFTVSGATGCTITKVVITFGSNDGSNTITTNAGTYSNGTWTGSASSVTFTVGGSSGHRRIKSLAVTYAKTTDAAPTYSNYVTECCTLNNINLDNSGTTTGGTFSATTSKACESEEITLSATAAECYAFVSWTIKKTSDDSDVTNSVLNSNTLTMPDYAVTVYATFKSLSVTEIALSMTGGHQNLDVGQTNQLLVTYTPADATCDKAIVSWTSSDDNVISVTNSGLVTARRSGNATITATTAAGISNTYTIVVNNPACEAWYLHYWNASTGGDECFYKVKPDDPNDHEWRTGNFSLPSNSDQDGFVVNNAKGEDPYKTDQIFRTGICFADIQRGGQNCGSNPYPGQNAYGQLSIYDDSETPNRYIAFYPAQYMVTFGKEGSSWVEMPLNNTTGYEYESEPFTVPNGYKTDPSYKYWVGITKRDGTIHYAAGKSSVDAMNGVNGLSADDMAGKSGVWHIYSNSCANNWYAEFIRYYRVDFDLNGGEGDIDPRYGKATTPYVTFSTSDITAPTRDGYTFLGWKNQNNKIYAPTGAKVTINNDFTLTALWKENYASNNCRWEEVTIDDIEYGDEVVIATYKNGYTYALKDNDGGASAAPKAALLTINSNKTINTEETPISNALIWNIDYDKEGTKNLVIYSTKNLGNWLYSNNNNDGVRIGTNSDKEFKIVAGTGDDAGNFFLYHIAQKRYLGVYYTNFEWRGYTTINTYITGQTLKFYKKVCLPEGQYWVKWDANGGAWSDGSTTKEEIYSVGATINNPDQPELDGYIFDCWEPTPSTMPANNTTFTAKWAEVCTVTYTVDNGDTAPREMQAVENTNITLPSLTTNLTCVKFVGWTDAASGYTHGTDKLYKAGDSYTVTENVTLHAVYAADGGYVLVTDEANLAVGDRVIIVNTDASVAMGGQNENNRAQVEVEIVNNTISNIGESQILTLEAGKTSGTFALYTGDGYLYAAGGSGDNGKNYLKTTPTLDSKGSWNISISNNVATIKSVEPTGTKARNWLRYNSINNPPIFSCYASGQKDVSIYKEDVAGYTTDPACVTYTVTPCTPTNGTISVDPTTVDPYGSTTVTFIPADGYMLQAVTVTSGTAIVGAPSYTTSQISGGTVRITDIQSDIEVCATFVEIPYYKVTFVDMNNGNAETIVPQSEFGGDITAPATASAGCDATWTFIGWAPSNSLNGTTEVPANLVEAGGTISGANITNNNLKYYSVYSNSSDGTPPFSIGKSGTYYFKAITEEDKVYYATGEMYSNKYRYNQETKIPFYVYYNTTTKKYTIKNTLTDKYVTPTYDNGWANALQEQATSFEWNILSYSNGDFTLYEETGSIYSDAKTGEYLFTYTNKSGNTRAIYFGGTYFESSGLTYDEYALYLEPASEMHYYNASSCTELVTMSFDVPADAVLTYADGYPEGYYKDSEKKTITTFPTLEYAGWTFIGWTAGTPYNDVIGEDYLNDENSSADAPTQTIYKTGVEYPLTSDVTMYPVFTKFADNEPFDMVNGGDYYIYYIADGDVATSEDEYGATNRIYAGGWGSGGTSDSYGATQSCASATLFTFTKLSNGKWSIYDNTKGRYLCAGATGNNLALNTTNATYGEWTITVHNGNQVNAVSKDGYTLSAQSQDATSGTFKNYVTSNLNNNSAYYHRIYVGSCTERVYSSNPSNKPTITLNGDVKVTSTATQSVKAASVLTVSASNIATSNLSITSDNAAFIVSPTTITVVDKKVGVTPITITYKPTITSDGTETATITVSDGNEASESITVTGRHLPENFVIAAKWGDNWYALPANMDSQSSTEGLLIEVDDAANPTKAIAAPNTTKYGLKSVYTSNSLGDRFANYGERLVFVENVEESTPVANKTLYNGGGSGTSNTNILVYAQYANYSSENAQAPRYEWIPTTTNLQDYTLTSAHQFTKDDATLENARTVSLDNHGEFGTLLQNKAYNGMVRLLPVDNFYGPAELQVVEWKANSVSIMYTGAGTKATTKVGNSESEVQLLSDNKIDHAVYTLSTSDLTSATNQPLTITIKDNAEATIGAITITIPAIVATNNTSTALGVTEENAKATSIVVLDGATLTADAIKYTYDDVTVYPGGKLVIGQSAQLGMYTLTLRAGSSWGAADYEHKYPQFVLNNSATNAYSNSSGQINLDYVTTKEQYYTFVAPFDVKTKDIKYPVDIYGSNVGKANSGSFEFQYYDGEARAAGSPGWKVVEEGAEGATLRAGQGYTFLGMPKKIAGTRQKYGIHRIPMKVAAGTAQSHETADQTVPLSVHLSAKNNNSGWNLVGNPYMSNVANLNNNDIQVGELVHTNDANGNWTGGWHWDNPTTGQRFLVIPSNDGKSYEAVQASNATLPAFKNFFVQISNANANAMSIPVANRVERNLAPARYAEVRPERDVEVAIVLEQDEAHSDQLDFLLNDMYSAAFDFNGDFTKMMNATNLNIYGVHTDDNLSFIAIDQHTAQQSIPIGYQVPAAGEYTLCISNKPYVMWNEIDALYVTDHEISPEVTVDLLHAPYEFSVNQAETNNERFTVSVRVKAKTENGATGLGNVGADDEQIHKFIYQDKMYILHHGVIYDATGKRVITINK